MSNAVFGKTMENVKKHKDMKLAKADKRRNELVLEPNHNTTKHFSENVLAIEIKKTKVIYRHVNTRVYTLINNDK